MRNYKKTSVHKKLGVRERKRQKKKQIKENEYQAKKNKLEKLQMKKVKIIYIDGVSDELMLSKIIHSSGPGAVGVRIHHPEIGKTFDMICKFMGGVFKEISGGPPGKIAATYT